MALVPRSSQDRTAGVSPAKCGRDGRGPGPRSAALEDRPALFHKGGAAFGVILARETLGDEPFAEVKVALAFGLQGLAHADLGRADRQRRVGRNRVAIIL